MRHLVCAFVAIVLAQAAPAAEPVSTATSAIQKPGKSFVRGGPLPTWAQPLAEVPPASRRDPLVFRLREVQGWVGPTPATLVNQALQVNDASALSVIGQYGISYNPAYQKLTLHRVAILRDGQVLDRLARANIRVLNQEDQLKHGIYGGASTIQLLLDDVRVGDTLWLTYSTEGANPVFGKRWSDEFSWDLPVPVELRRVTILHPRQRPLTWRQLGDFGDDAIKPVVDQTGDFERLRFEARGLEGVETEPSTPTDYLPQRMLQMSEYDSWQGVAGWAASLFPPAPPSPALQQTARRFASLPDKAAQAAAALHWVQDEIRYFSVSIGENSHRPQPPETVLSRRFGDCKDKAYLLVSLLGQLGIPAHPMLVNARAPALPGKITPSPTWFDHVIVALELDGKTVYVDPTETGQKGPLDQLPPVLPGAQALPVDAAATALVVLPDRDDGRPPVERIDRIVVDAFDGDATLESHEIYRGDYAASARLRTASMNAKETQRHVLAPYEKTYPGLKLIGAPRLVDTAEQGTFEIVSRFTLPKPIELAKGRYSLPYTSQVMEGTLGIPDNLSRQFPFAYPRGKFFGRYRLNVVFPKDIRDVGQLSAKTIDNDFLHLHEEYAFRSNYLDYVLDYRLKSDRIAAADLPRLQRESKQLTPYIEATFRMWQGSVATGAGALSLRAIDLERSKQALLESKNLFEKGANGKLDDGAQCEMLHAFEAMRIIDMPESGSVVRSVLHAIEQDGHAGTGACSGDLLFARGAFKDAIAAYSRAKLADADPASATQAWARLYLHDGEGAAGDMLRYLRARQKAGDLSALDLADAAALLKQAGAALPDEFALARKELPDGPWPRPLLALQGGAMTPETLVARAMAMPGDARELALDEAWFYIGEQALAAGDRRGAWVAFQRVRAHAVIGSAVYGRTLAALAALESDDPDYRAGVALSWKDDQKGAVEAWARAAGRGVAEAQFRLGMAYHYGDGVGQDRQAAAHWFDLAARQDHPSAANMIGLYLRNGYGGLAQDSKAANEWYRRGAELGDDVAAFNLGSAYSDGDGVARDRTLGARYLQQAAELNNLSAQELLIWRFAEGDGVARDDRVAALWAERAAARGSVDAAVDLGRFLWVGRGVEKNPQLGTKMIRAAAERGNRKAMYFMGEAYQAGHAVDKDSKTAFEWFEKAARAGHSFAKFQLGLAYLAGRGVAPDLDKSMMWLERADADDVAQASAMLGYIYAKGKERPVDLPRSAAYFTKAAQAGEPEAEWQLGLILRDGKGVKADAAQAAVWMRKASDADFAQAMTELARMYQAGIGVERDDAMARRYFRNGARGGDCEAMSGLGGVYENGRGVKQDLRMAMVFYTLAARDDGQPARPLCASAAASARQLTGRLDAAQIASAQAVAEAWKAPAPLPDESEAATVSAR